jgi:hypothetical protein
MANYESRRNHPLITRIAVYLLSLLFALGAPISTAQSSSEENLELADRIIFVSGSLIARGTSGDRPLGRRNPIYVGDTIFTHAQASSQIRMVVDALIARKESTEFAIVAYQYEQDISSDESTIELIQGGFRTLTGRVCQQNKEADKAQTSDFPAIGIRGTDFEVVITGNGVFTGVYDGRTTVSNDSGSLDLGIQASYDFAQVATPNSPPAGLLEQPPGFGIAPFAATIDEEPNSSSLNLQTPTTELAVQETQADTSGPVTRGSQEDAVSNLTVNPSETSTDGSVSCATDSSLCLHLVNGQVIGDTNSGNGNSGNNGNGNSGSDDDTTIINNDDDTSSDGTDSTTDDTTTDNSGNNGGEISSLIAGMSVDFEIGVIDQGTLAVLVADQTWAIEFGGSVLNGVVDLNATSGQLLDSTGIISNSIDTNLGGVFSRNTGSAFVGGFDLIDEMNTYNTVNGLFTIER